MKRGLFLLGAALTVTVTSVLMWGKTEPAEASIQHVYELNTQPVEVPYLDMDLEHLAIVTEYRQAHENAPESTETAEMKYDAEIAENTPELTYLGAWTCTAYCCGACCCGEYATGYTASGTLATEGRTIACNVLPFGTQVMIDGNTYVVEDTGWTPYGDAWIDIYFDSHEDALNFGVQTKDIYEVN